MQKEIDSAVQFICGLLQARRLSLDLLETFRRVLCEVMSGWYEGHWFPDKPDKGTGYRCMRINSNSIDPLIVRAATLSGLSPAQLQQLLPNQLTIWVDPRVVSYRFGEDGSVATLYDGNKLKQRVELDDDLGSTGSGSSGSSVASLDSVSSSPSLSPVPICSSPSTDDDDNVVSLNISAGAKLSATSCRQEIVHGKQHTGKHLTDGNSSSATSHGCSQYLTSASSSMIVASS